jgi:hypothetical protein
MQVQVTKTGPLFEKPDLLLAVHRAMQDGALLVGRRMAARLSAHRGPGRHGHLADAVRTRVEVRDGRVEGAVFLGGKGAFKGVFLEKGTRAVSVRRRGHGPFTYPTERRDRAVVRATGHHAALRVNGRFYARLPRHGMPARPFAAPTLDETWPQVRELLQDAAVRLLNGR